MDFGSIVIRNARKCITLRAARPAAHHAADGAPRVTRRRYMRSSLCAMIAISCGVPHALWSAPAAVPLAMLVAQTLEHAGVRAWVLHHTRDASACWLPAAWLANDAVQIRNVRVLAAAQSATANESTRSFSCTGR